MMRRLQAPRPPWALICGLAWALSAGPAIALAPREPVPAAPPGLIGALEALGAFDLGPGLIAWPNLPAADALGGPRADLTPRQLLAFAAGRVAFERRFAPAEGLGPHLNEPSCASCHQGPVVGGGGVLPEHVIHVHEPADLPGETVGLRRQTLGATPPERPGPRRGRRRTPPLFGIGLLDGLDDAALAAQADPDDRDGDGVRGVFNQKRRGGEARSSRFGAKAHEWNLHRFIGGAMRDEMGMTNRAAAGAQADADAAADPEVNDVTMRQIDAFVRGLAPPPAAVPVDRKARALVERGRALFAGIGCTGCHRPDLGGVRGVYSDLLLHDLGAGLDAGLADGPASARQWRTPPLWGLRLRPKLLHDERASSPAEAVRWHDGEAAGARGRLDALPARERAAVFAFLEHL